MKTILRLSALMLFASFVFTGCKKDETKLYYTGGTAPALTTIASADTVSYVNADTTVLTLNWTNPGYTFSTGAGSLDVTYNIQIDAAGANFANAYNITVSKNLTYQFTASALNDIMQNQLSLKPAVQHTLKMRVISSLTNNSVQLTSNAVQFTATPYIIPPKVTPLSGNLYIIGSAITGNGDGWSNPVDTSKYKFSKTDDLHFSLVVKLYSGQEYLFLPVNGDWGHKYACNNEATQPKTGGDFGADLSSNFPSPSTDGTYKIDVDFQKGKYTLTKQ